MARARSKAWISATQQIPSTEHLQDGDARPADRDRLRPRPRPEATFPGAGGMPILTAPGVVDRRHRASGATVGPFFPAGIDPRMLIAEGKPANPEDLLVA